MQRIGLIGFPVEHSLSPVFQQAAFDALGLDVRYELWPTTAEQMPQRVSGLRSPNILGANVTVPHKQRAFDLVDRASDVARQAGAVNTIIKAEGELLGDNTDVPGFLAPLRSRGLPLVEMRVVVLGAGGAARGVVVALLAAGCESILVANRTLERARGLARELGGAIEVSDTGSDLIDRLSTADLLVNATSIGWQSEQLPLNEAGLANLPATSLVYDLTYRETALLRLASSRGLATLDGLEMLVAQGAESFRLWTGQEPPVELMLSAARAAASDR